MYDITDYARMLADRRRLSAYAEALGRAVRTGAVVLEIGAGPGLHAVVAARLGARKVYAIEPNPVIHLARQIVEANGYADRVECIQALSTSVSPAQKADVIVSDLRDVLPLYGRHIETIVDARARLLSPGGVLVPLRDSLWAAVVEAPDQYRTHVGPWEGGWAGIDMTPGRDLAINSWCKTYLTPEQLMVEPQRWTTLEYASVTSPHVEGRLAWEVSRPGTAHGLCLWFESVLVDGVTLSNAPDSPPLLYGSAFFPWPQPVELRQGDRIEVEIRATLVNGDYVWQWNSSVVTAAAGALLRFRQSTFAGELVALPSPAPATRADAPALQSSGGKADPVRLAQAQSADYWRALSPALAIGGGSPAESLEREPVRAQWIAALTNRFAEEGYFQMPTVLPAALVRQMRDAVEAVRREGWPPVFAYVYDEFWLALRAAPITAFLEGVLGPGYRRIPHVWTHYVQPRPGAGGWPPHFDDASRPKRVTVWIALSAATLDNGCIYVIPRTRVPAHLAADFPELRTISVADSDALMHGCRALPAQPGTAMGWAFDVVHWGSVCSADASPDEPRISISQEFIASDVQPEADERPLLEGGGPLPTLEERLHVIAKAVLAYQRFDPQPEAAVAARLIRP